jgi:2-octaprenyl-6-methoxyphenol hydroxylase
MTRAAIHGCGYLRHEVALPRADRYLIKAKPVQPRRPMTGGSARQAHVLIAGGSFAGLSLAVALRQALGPSFEVVVADPALDLAGSDPRASAIVAAARRLLETIGVWRQVAEGAQPILDMAITDSRLDDVARPTFLTFHGEVEEGEPFAHMIENGPLLAALVAKAKEVGVTLMNSAVAGFEIAGDRVMVHLQDGASLNVGLLVAADGARSSIRERAGIATHGWQYGQSSIVTTVRHERDHNGRAEEHFLPAGPFAILPLKRDANGHRSSIVWTEEGREAERIVALDDEAFHAELEKRFGLHLGEIEAVGPRRAFPLGLHVARAFVSERIALVGDAAHVIHPIAGQGLNMGLKDVAALAEVIVDAARLGLDPGSAVTLDRYQRWRRFDTMAMGVATDGLNRLFSNRSDALRVVRDVGLGLVDRLPGLKRLFIQEAAGITGEVPKLLKGEAL